MWLVLIFSHNFTTNSMGMVASVTATEAWSKGLIFWYHKPFYLYHDTNLNLRFICNLHSSLNTVVITILSALILLVLLMLSFIGKSQELCSWFMFLKRTFCQNSGKCLEKRVICKSSVKLLPLTPFLVHFHTLIQRINIASTLNRY